jgi:hypothetical protein
MRQELRKFKTNLARRGSAEALKFDRSYWSNTTPDVRFAAAWQMCLDWAILKGKTDVHQSGLQRSVHRKYYRKKGIDAFKKNDRPTSGSS